MNGFAKRVWAEVSMGTLAANFGIVAAAAKPAAVLCVVKANAYGLGAGPYVARLAAAGAAGFGVADLDEALEAKSALARIGRADLPVQILSCALPHEIAPAVAAGVTLPVTDFAAAKRIAAAAKKAGRRATVQFKLDTGMGRLGIRAEEAPAVIRRSVGLPELDCEGAFSHCPLASDPENGFTDVQVDLFKAILADVAKDGIRFRKVHLAASDAINNFPRTHRAPFNLVRAGLDLHGYFGPRGRALGLRSVVSVKARVAQVRVLPAGATVGYGRTFSCARATRVATLAAGYADGVPLALTNRGRVFVNGVSCPVVGRVSMDYTTVDVTRAGRVAPGDEAILLGRAGDGEIAPDEWGAFKGTHAWDALCSLGPRVARVIVD